MPFKFRNILTDFMNSGFQKKTDTLNNQGYDPTEKLVIIHADDFGLCQSVNKACILVFEKGMVSSGSIMVPCDAAEEAILYSVLHPELDLGIHLTLTSEWVKRKWKPVLGNLVPSLTDREGFFYENCRELQKNALLADVEPELRAQIHKAVSLGMKPTHLDCHMFCCAQNPDFLRVYLKLGQEFNIPVLLNRDKYKKWFGYDIEQLDEFRNIVVNELIIARQHHLRKGLDSFYHQTLKRLKPGITCILIHPSFDDQEMREMTSTRRNFNSFWRQSDVDFFSGDECQKIMREQNIRITDWKEIKMRQQKSNNHEFYSPDLSY